MTDNLLFFDFISNSRYYKLIAKRLAQKGVISEIEADSIRPDIQVTGAARNSLAGKKPESSSPSAEE